MSHRGLVAALLPVALTVSACGGNGTDEGGAAATTPETTQRGPAVIAKGVSFSPPQVEIARGQTVTWRFADRAVSHNVVAEGFESRVQRSGTFEHTFDEAGTYAYRCTLHPTMKGSVHVS